MHAIETETLELEGSSYRLTIYLDEDSPNPLTDWDGMGRILSLNRRHANFDAAGVEEALEHDPDAVPLGYFEHGLCRWSVAGELAASCQCPWDSVAFAGLWLPDAEILAAARHYGGWTRRQYMRLQARHACEVYSQWCNGEVYGYEVSRVSSCLCCEEEQAEPVDRCWGFYGLDECRAEARAVIGSRPTRAA